VLSQSVVVGCTVCESVDNLFVIWSVCCLLDWRSLLVHWVDCYLRSLSADQIFKYLVFLQSIVLAFQWTRATTLIAKVNAKCSDEIPVSYWCVEVIPKFIGNEKRPRQVAMIQRKLVQVGWSQRKTGSRCDVQTWRESCETMTAVFNAYIDFKIRIFKF
jgi:hypothetical protein